MSGKISHENLTATVLILKEAHVPAGTRTSPTSSSNSAVILLLRPNLHLLLPLPLLRVQEPAHVAQV